MYAFVNTSKNKSQDKNIRSCGPKTLTRHIKNAGKQDIPNILARFITLTIL